MTPAQLGHLAMLGFSALVAGSFALGVLAANEIPPAALNAVRFWLAAGIIGTAVLLHGGATRAHFERPWRYLVLGGLFAGYFVLMFEGLKTAEAVSASAVFTLTPIMSAIFGWALLRQVTTARMAGAIAIGGCGALWVIFRADINALLAFSLGRGEIVYFLGCILHALYTPMIARLNKGEPALIFTFGMLVAGAVLLTLVGWRDIMATDWRALPAIVWITIAYLSVFASAASFLLLQIASLRLPSAKVMAYTYLTPSWVIIWQVALGNGLPPIAILAGVALTVFALLLLLRDDSPRPS